MTTKVKSKKKPTKKAKPRMTVHKGKQPHTEQPPPQDIPKPRPTAPAARCTYNLEIISMPTGKSPLPFTEGTTPDKQSVLEWAEALRDLLESQGKALTAEGLLVYARSAIGMSVEPLVRDLYAAELDPPTARPLTWQVRMLKPGMTARSVVSHKGATVYDDVFEVVDPGGDVGEAKIKILATGSPRADRPAGTVVRVGPSMECAPGNREALLALFRARGENAVTAVNGKPAGAGAKACSPSTTDRQPRAERKPRTPAAPRLQAAPAKLNNATKIPVTWEGEGGKHRAKVFEHPLRSLARWMGKDGWSNARAVACFQKLGLGDYPNLTNKIVPAHVGAGRAGSDVHGPVPDVAPAEAKALRAVAPEV